MRPAASSMRGPREPTRERIVKPSLRTSASAPGTMPLRSQRGMNGLLLAERGEAMVEFDPLGGASGFREGRIIASELISPDPSNMPEKNGLSRQSTLLSIHPSAQQLKTVLSSNSRRLTSSPKGTASAIAFEQAKSSPRMELDMSLENDVCVEGGCIKGKLAIHIRKAGKNEGIIRIGGGKLRVVGFEAISQDQRHTFYQHAEPLATVCKESGLLCISSPDEEGLREARDGTFSLPFSMLLPVGGGAKGILKSRSGVLVRYVVMVSIKITNGTTSAQSIAHVYRACSIYPFYNPAKVLSPSSRPLQSSASKSLFLGGSGKVVLTAAIHRKNWVAGQQCWVKIHLENGSTKRIKSVTFALTKVTTIFRPNPHLDTGFDKYGSRARMDPDACQTTTVRKTVCESVLEAGQRRPKHSVTAKGHWMGLEAGGKSEFSHCIAIPPEALSIMRSRLVEVEYVLRVSVSAGTLASSDVYVDLPICIINFLSIDPPPEDVHILGPNERFSKFTPSSVSVADVMPTKQRTVSDDEFELKKTKRARAVTFSETLRRSMTEGGTGLGLDPLDPPELVKYQDEEEEYLPRSSEEEDITSASKFTPTRLSDDSEHDYINDVLDSENGNFEDEEDISTPSKLRTEMMMAYLHSQRAAIPSATRPLLPQTRDPEVSSDDSIEKTASTKSNGPRRLANSRRTSVALAPPAAEAKSSYVDAGSLLQDTKSRTTLRHSHSSRVLPQSSQDDSRPFPRASIHPKGYTGAMANMDADYVDSDSPDGPVYNPPVIEKLVPRISVTGKFSGSLSSRKKTKTVIGPRDYNSSATPPLSSGDDMVPTSSSEGSTSIPGRPLPILPKAYSTMTSGYDDATIKAKKPASAPGSVKARIAMLEQRSKKVSEQDGFDFAVMPHNQRRERQGLRGVFQEPGK